MQRERNRELVLVQELRMPFSPNDKGKELDLRKENIYDFGNIHMVMGKKTPEKSGHGE